MNFIPCIVLLSVCFCQARTWTDVQGRAIEAEMVGAGDDNVTVDRGGKEVKLPMARLCESDRKFVKDWLAGHDGVDAGMVSSTPNPAMLGLQFDGKPLTPGGQMNVFEYPYSPEMQKKISKKFKATDTGYKIAIAVPANFDPSKPQRVFIPATAVNNDNEARSGNLGAFKMYASTCVANGWVCLAYDTNIGRASHDSDIHCAFDKLKSVWPGITGWEFAVGGFSGGAKGCFNSCGFLLKAKCKVVGAFLGGCNEDHSGSGRDRYNAPSSNYRNIKVFMSTGKNDNLVDANHIKIVLASLKGNGLRQQRNELFDGGHQFHVPHFEQALKWFSEPPPTK